jgi:hypothetical protein
MGYPDPIQPNIEATHINYHTVLDEILRVIGNKEKASVMVASHNERTVRIAIESMADYNIPTRCIVTTSLSQIVLKMPCTEEVVCTLDSCWACVIMYHSH